MRAIILAAGMGSRLRPLTLNTPKPLIKINNESIIERQIKFIREIGINEIIVVTGYLKEKFEFLKDKYGVKIIYNDKYDVYNNIYTMYLIRDYLPNSYVFEGDIYLKKNILKNNIKKSSYFSAAKYGYKNEWILRIDEKNNVIGIDIGSEDGQHIMCGVSYWNKKDAEFIKAKLDKYIMKEEFDKLYWDHIIKDNIQDIEIQLVKIDSDDIYEIDSLEDLEKLNEIVGENR